MQHPRWWRIVTALSGTALVATFALAGSAPAQAEPDIDTVQKRVDRLFHEAEQASERLHDAELELEELQRDLDSLSADQERQDASLETARDELQDSLVSQYQGQSLSAVGQVVEVTASSAYVDGRLHRFTVAAQHLDGPDLRRGKVVGSGEVTRVVVDAEKFLGRLAPRE